MYTGFDKLILNVNDLQILESLSEWEKSVRACYFIF